MNVDSERKICPYVGLQPFRETDREFFFGRESDQRIIIANMIASPLTILYGASGVGKSSVLMAGVVPQLRRERPKTPVIVFRDWVKSEFLQELTRDCIDEVWKAGRDQPKPAETLPFDEILRACAEAAHETVLVILDQFEEYFLYHPKSSDSSSFEAQLARAVNRDDIDVGFLISLRDDSLAKLDRFKERIPELMSNRLALSHLDPAGAAEAIRRPLTVWNQKYAKEGESVAIEDDLIDELIRQVVTGQVSTGRHGGSGAPQQEKNQVEAPFLQLVMVRLWNEERGAGSNALRRETLDRLKGAREIVRTHLGDVMAHLDAASKEVCATFFDRLVTPSGTKVACWREDLIGWAGDLAAQVPSVLKALEDHRILRTVAAPPDNPRAVRYEIFHDVLAPAILDWLHGYVADQERSQAVKDAREHAAKRALHQWLAALATMTAIAIAGWLYATWEELRAEANQKAAESVYTALFDPGRSLDLALEAVETTALFGMSPIQAARLGFASTPAAEDALRQAIQTSRLEWTLRAGDLVSDIAFSPDPEGLMLATAGKDGNARVWDLSTGHPRKTPFVFGHEKWVRDVAFLPTGDRLVTVADDTAYLWSLDHPHTPIRSFAHGGPIYSAFAVNRDGSRLATAGNGSGNKRVIKVWDLASPSPRPDPIATIDVQGDWIMGLAFSPDGGYLATANVEFGGPDRTATGLWDIATKTERLRVPTRKESDAVMFTPDGSSLVTASRDNYVRVWKPAHDSLDAILTRPDGPSPWPESTSVKWLERILAGHGERVRCIAISPDGTRIASGGGDNLVKLWDAKTGENMLTLRGHRGFVEAVSFTPNGHHLASASRDRTVKFWNIAGHTGAVTSIAFGPNGNGTTLATGGADRTAKLWDVSGSQPRLLHTLHNHTDQVSSVAFDPQGARVATAGHDNSVKLWDVASGDMIASFEKHKDQLRDVAFSPNGKFLASAGADGHAWLYPLDASADQAAAIPVKHFGQSWAQASAVAFHPLKEDQWATAGHDGRLQLWSISGEHLGTIVAPVAQGDKPPAFTRMAFSPDGATVAALFRHWIYLWPVTAFSQAEMEEKEPNSILTVEGAGYCRALAYSEDGSQIAVGCDDAVVRVFDTAGETLVKTITVHQNAVSAVAFSPDGTRLATASFDKTFHVSPLRFETLYETAKRLQSNTSGESFEMKTEKTSP